MSRRVVLFDFVDRGIRPQERSAKSYEQKPSELLTVSYFERVRLVSKRSTKTDEMCLVCDFVDRLL
jgi:hypothetical protein